MKSMPKWFLIPPAVAALLVLGTLSMQGGSGSRDEPRTSRGQTTPPGADTNASPNPATAPGAANRREPPQLPRTPDLTQMVSALGGVLLLGVGGVMLLRRLRGPARAPRGASLLTLRQTLRLTQRQAVHAIEFDDRLLLVGESERGLTLLDGGKLPERTTDEADVLARAATAARVDDMVDDADDGAVPKNLVIPRPPHAVPRRLPSAPAVGLADFRNLLQKAGRP